MTETPVMEARSRRIIAVVAAMLAVYVFLVGLPAVLGTTVVGFQGNFEGGDFRVSRVLADTPAQQAGLRPGDVLVSADGTTLDRWAELYASRFDDYLSRYASWADREVQLEVRRADELVVLGLSPRDINGRDYVRGFGIRTLFGLFLATLVVILLLSDTRERSAFYAALLMLFVLLWQFSGIRYWPMLLAPMFQAFESGEFLAGRLGTEVALQLVPSTMLMVALEFPVRHRVYRRWPGIWLPVYLVPAGIMLLVIVLAEGSLHERLNQAYLPRVALNSLALVLVVALQYTGYRDCRSPTHRARTRWVVGAMIVALACILVAWNLPVLLGRYPLIPDFDWLLLPMALVPLAMTMAMINHHLFGVRGLIRGRILMLERMLDREKAMVSGRDRRIRGLVREMDELRAELQHYSATEQPQHPPGEDSEPRWQQLQQRFPGLDAIRRDHLLGASPVWTRVFEQIAMASRGLTPVLVVGESGTGKTDTARAIHRLGERADQPYRELSCSQFEHADPAFALGRLFGVGAGHGLQNVPREGQPGLLEECDGGTLFLDDFDCLPRNVQDLLLYPLEGKPFEPGIGRGPAREVSIKFILATNRDPQWLVEQGILRSDIPTRLGTRVDIPPLRERREDIPLLAEHFLEDCAAEVGHEITMISPRALHALASQDFAAGNVRELRSELRQAIGRAMLEDDPILRAGYLSNTQSVAAPTGAASTAGSPGVSGAGITAGESRPGGQRAVGQVPPAGQPHELTVLRRHDFRIKESEQELGYSQKSRTLSNHLRGICIQAMVDHQWDELAAARFVVGSDDSQVIDKVRGKIRRYMDNIRNSVASGEPRRLYNNLPAAYHDALDATVKQFRDGGDRRGG